MMNKGAPKILQGYKDGSKGGVKAVAGKVAKAAVKQHEATMHKGGKMAKGYKDGGYVCGMRSQQDYGK